MNASDHAFWRWFALPEAKALFAPEGHYNIFLVPAPLLKVCRLPFLMAFVTFLIRQKRRLSIRHCVLSIL